MLEHNKNLGNMFGLTFISMGNAIISKKYTMKKKYLSVLPFRVDLGPRSISTNVRSVYEPRL